MNIGIVEIMERGHVTLLECVARIYLSDSRNYLSIFIREGAEKQARKLFSNYKNIDYIVKKESESDAYFLAKINSYSLDLAYFITFEQLNLLPIFYKINYRFPIRLFVHNIDFWFQVPFSERCIKFVKTSIAQKGKGLGTNFKDHFYNFPFTKKIINQVISNKGKIVVLNSTLKENISQYVDNQEDVIVIPFSFREKTISNQSQSNTKIRLCLPGFVTQRRRDYFGILEAAEQNLDFFNSNISIEFLGSFNLSFDKSVGQILEKSKQLIAKGLDLTIHEEGLIPTREFDKKLSESDFILANLTPILGYGKTKESGIPFTMIKVAKPGLFQVGCPTLDELKNITVYFENYEHLMCLVSDFKQNKHKMNELKTLAIEITEIFTPEKIYKQLH